MMKKYNFWQSGFFSFNIIALVLLAGALTAGLYLVSHRTSLRSLADNPPSPNLTLQSKFIDGSKISSSLVNVVIYADPSVKADKYRLANFNADASTTPDPATLNWVEYTYPDWASPSQPVNSVWHLSPFPGNKKVVLQFHTADGWQTKLYQAPIKLVQTANPLSLSAQCKTDKGATKSKIVTRWDAKSIQALQTAFLWLQLYSSDGTLIADFPNPDLSKDYTFEIDTPKDNFTLIGIPYLPNDSDRPLDLVKPLGYSEFTTSCDPATLPTNLSLTFQDDNSYQLTWTGLLGYSEVPLYNIKPGFQVYLSSDTSNNPFCGSCQILFQNVLDSKKLKFDNSLTGFSPRPEAVNQTFTKLTKGQRYTISVSSGAYRLGDKVVFTAK